MVKEDWIEVKRIYEEGIASGLATFETSAPSWEDWDKSHLKDCRFIAYDNSGTLGWAALSPVSDRCVYGGVAEVSVYVSSISQGRGVGMALMNSLIYSSEKKGYWTLQSGIFSDNIPSIRLHEKAGFRKIGIRERIGQYKGVWKDNVLMERRSKTIGVDEG